MLKILGKHASINVRKVTWICDELGLPFEREDWGTGFRDTHDPAFLKLNPMAQVPVLIDDDFTLWESNTIVRYLASDSPSMYPKAPRTRAKIEQWMDWQATELNPTWRPAFPALARGAAHPPGEVAASVQRWNTMMGILDRQLALTGAYVAGPHFTIADVPVGLSVHRWLHTPMDRADYPAIVAYDAQLRHRPAFAAHAQADVP